MEIVLPYIQDRFSLPKFCKTTLQEQNMKNQKIWKKGRNMLHLKSCFSEENFNSPLCKLTSGVKLFLICIAWAMCLPENETLTKSQNCGAVIFSEDSTMKSETFMTFATVSETVLESSFISKTFSWWKNMTVWHTWMAIIEKIKFYTWENCTEAQSGSWNNREVCRRVLSSFDCFQIITKAYSTKLATRRQNSTFFISKFRL